MNQSKKVTLYVYDLSQGMASVMAPMIVGRPVEGVWHTSIVVFGIFFILLLLYYYLLYQKDFILRFFIM